MMMTEEQHLANALTAFIGRPLDNPLTRSEIMGTARIALAALTQPASQALKLPDGWVEVPNEPTEDMIAAGSAVDGGVYSIWKDMVSAAPDAPHTAPIEPICATGGAEWVKVSERMPEVNEEVIAFIAQSHEYKGKAFPGVRYEEYWWLNGEMYSYDEVSHWQLMPAAPEEA